MRSVRIPPTHRRAARYLLRAAAVTVLAGVLLALSTGAVWAQPPAEPPEPNSLEQVVDNLRWWIMGIIAAVATLFLVVGGMRYITAGGDPSQIEQAKGNLKSAMLGYGLAVLAPVFMTILSSTILGV